MIDTSKVKTEVLFGQVGACRGVISGLFDGHSSRLVEIHSSLDGPCRLIRVYLENHRSVEQRIRQIFDGLHQRLGHLPVRLFLLDRGEVKMPVGWRCLSIWQPLIFNERPGVRLLPVRLAVCQTSSKAPLPFLLSVELLEP
ncbi:MAG: hypothetical protein ABIJ46_04830 [bacterium]